MASLTFNNLFEIFRIGIRVLIVIGLIYAAYFYIVSRQRYKVGQDLNGNKITYAGGVTNLRENDKAGGYLILTQKELVFLPHALSKDTKEVRIKLQDIKSVRHYYTLKFIPTGLALELNVGSEEKFWVFRHRKWQRMISENLSRYA